MSYTHHHVKVDFTNWSRFFPPDTFALRKRRAERRELEVVHLEVLKALLSRESRQRNTRETNRRLYKNLSCSRGNKKKIPQA